MSDIKLNLLCISIFCGITGVVLQIIALIMKLKGE